MFRGGFCSRWPAGWRRARACYWRPSSWPFCCHPPDRPARPRIVHRISRRPSHHPDRYWCCLRSLWNPCPIAPLRGRPAPPRQPPRSSGQLRNPCWPPSSARCPTLNCCSLSRPAAGRRPPITARFGQALLPSPRSAAEQESLDPAGEYGIVDLAVVDPADGRVLYEEIDPLIRALRAAGFAAWLRDRAELSPKSEAYVHAGAIGDRQLSDEALAQLSGPDGYFHGGRGLGGDVLLPDRHGGPVLCRWMYQPAVADPRAGPSSAGPAVKEPRWELRLQAVAESFITSDLE